MIITTCGKPIEISQKNVRAFEKMHHMLPDAIDIEIYIEAYNRPQSATDVLANTPIDEVSKMVNTAIKIEACNCFSLEFYNNA